MWHSAENEKCKREALWDSLTYIQLQNIKKLKGGTLRGHNRNERSKQNAFAYDGEYCCLDK